MAQVQNLNKVVSYLRARAKDANKQYRVTVGFTQHYAIYVHENLETEYKVGQAKFLEQPARELQPELAAIVRTAAQAGIPLGQALLMAGLRLQREAQLLCPVDTGALKNSAFTRLEEKGV